MTETVVSWGAFGYGRHHFVGQPLSAIFKVPKLIDDNQIRLAINGATAGLVTVDDDDEVKGKKVISISPDTLCRSMARLLRAKGASLEDIGGWLGHRIPNADLTEVFTAPADPTYLLSARGALEKSWTRLRPAPKWPRCIRPAMIAFKLLSRPVGAWRWSKRQGAASAQNDATITRSCSSALPS